MPERPPPPRAADKPLFTPGPLTTSRTVKLAMMRDLGSRDRAFLSVVRRVREGLVALAGQGAAGRFEAVLMQGSGTFGIEATIGSVLAPGGRLLVLANGAYGERMAKIAEVLRIPATVLRAAEDAVHDPDAVARELARDAAIAAVALVHCETTSGILNPVLPIGAAVRAAGRTFILDSMSAFGGVPLDVEAAGVDFLVSSANKCIEGVPGFSFVLARREKLAAAEGRARSLALDLHAQWRGLEANGQFRFTPPTHAVLAFAQALDELEAEGGVAGRHARYSRNHAVLNEGMRALGFEPFLPAALQAPVITSFRYPEDPAFRFERFYERLNDEGYVIYPGKLTQADTFRIGTIGRLFEADVRGLLAAVARVR